MKMFAVLSGVNFELWFARWQLHGQTEEDWLVEKLALGVY